MPALPARIARGVCFAHSWEHAGARGYGTETSRAQLVELRALGADWISLTPFGLVHGPSDPEVHLPGQSVPGAETDARVRAEIAAAHALGLRVLLKPHLWVSDGSWIAALEPASDEGYRVYAESYARFVLHWAQLAAELDVEAFAIGVELDSLVRHEGASLEALIADVRAVYRGTLTYGASWNHVDEVPFWGALDAIGVHLYAPLSTDPAASEAQLRAGLEPALDRLAALSRAQQRPLWITEVGFTSTPASFVRPWVWPDAQRSARADPRDQARALRVTLSALGARPEVEAIHVWKWFTDPDTREEGAIGFSPRGKPAEAVLRAAFGGCER